MLLFYFIFIESKDTTLFRNNQEILKKSCVEERKLQAFLYQFIQVSHVSSTRPERAEAPSPGHRPGLLRTQTCRPVRAKALKLQAKHKAFALTGRLADCHHTQGDALG